MDKMQRYTIREFEDELNIEYVHCIRYEDFGRKSFGEYIQVNDEVVFVSLLERQRSSEQITDLAFFMNRHTETNTLNVLVPNIPLKKSFNGSVPQWLEVKDIKAFVEYAKTKLSEHKDVMILRDYNGVKESKIESLCSELNWKYCNEHTVRGSESSLIIIYDWIWFTYEAFTRAKHDLLIVTLQGEK